MISKDLHFVVKCKEQPLHYISHKRESEMNKNDEMIRKATGNRLTKEIKRVYPGKAWQNDFLRQLELNGTPVSRVTISAICNGRANLTAKNAELFSRFLGVSSEYLLCHTDNPRGTEADAENEKIISVEMNKTAAKYKRTRRLIERFLIISDLFRYDTSILFEDGFMISRDSKTGSFVFYQTGKDRADTPEPVRVDFDSVVQSLAFTPHTIRVPEITPNTFAINSVRIASGDLFLSLSINEFFRFCHELTDAVEGRFSSWFRYHDFDFSDESELSFAFWLKEDGTKK